MKVIDIINTHFSFANPNIKFLVKPKGTDTIYYSGDGSYIKNEVAEMEVQRWLIDNEKKNSLIFVISVKQDKDFEEKKRKFLEK